MLSNSATLSTLLRKSGEQNEALVLESFGMALNLIDNADDPELRGAVLVMVLIFYFNACSPLIL